MEVKDSIVYQDNKSTILLAENGKASSGRRTRHINIRYFFVKDRIASGEVKIEHCPTQEMMADFFTKPLQGGLFIKMRDGIMNLNPQCVSYANEDCRSVLNVVDGHDNMIETSGTGNDWLAVKSKRTKTNERMRSRVSAGKNGSVSRVNGQRDTEQVMRFGESRNSLIIF